MGRAVRQVTGKAVSKAVKFVSKGKVLLLFLVVSHAVSAEDYCFTLAGNFYEQLYCEIQAKGKGDQLPAYRDFLRNDPTTQALLLKRPARKLGINVPMPKVESRTDARPSGMSQPVARTKLRPGPGTINSLQGCRYQQGVIQCAANSYRFVQNQPNHQLAAEALNATNKMAIPLFGGALNDASAVGSYLASAYPIYLDKMISIGLGAATMSYAKFHYFFYDISEKGISFSERFETLYHYLKKDKRSLPIRKVSAPESLDLNQCEQVTPDLLACSAGQRNYLFVK